MRRFCPLASALFAAIAAGAAPASGAAGHCSEPLPQAPSGLPAPVVVTTDCGRFEVGPSGSVVFESARTRPVPAVASAYWLDLTWVGRSHGHLLIGRAMKTLWRSHDTYRARHAIDVGAVVLGRRKLVFSYFRRWPSASRLYLAGYGGKERVVARGETPLAFTASGELVTRRDHDGALLLRRGDGRFERMLARRTGDAQADPQGRVVAFRTATRLFVFDGVRVRQLATFRKVGITGRPILEPLGRLVAVRDRRRLVVLAYDGRVVASSALPTGPKRADGVSSSVVANPSGTAVAFTATSGNTAYGSHGHETVYELSAGQTQAQALYRQELDFAVCERTAWLAWQGDWLLYAASEQHAAAVDSSGAASPIDFSALIAGLPGYRSDGEGIFDVAWAGDL